MVRDGIKDILEAVITCPKILNWISKDQEKNKDQENN